ncbi:MAG TPA: hypothetical protein VFG83_12440 [Kofleriaceae bacterium]|nr:hypothetical protein [Kofleriaceae bacterium]
MSHLFGCVCNEPPRLGEALQAIEPQLTVPGPVARFGLGYVQAGEVLLSRNPRGQRTAVDFFAMLRQLPSDYVVGCTTGEDGLSGSANTPPYRYRRWLFGQPEPAPAADGSRPLARVGELCAAVIPAFLDRSITGKTTAEHIFHVFLAMLHDTADIDDPNLPVPVIRRALRDAIQLIDSRLAGAGIGERVTGNIIVTNSRSMLAVRLGDAIYVRRVKHPDPRRSDHRLFRAVLALSGISEPGEGFEAIPESSVLTISRDLMTDIVPLAT